MSSMFPTFRAVQLVRNTRTGKERRTVREFYSEADRSAWLEAAPLYVVRQREEDTTPRAVRPESTPQSLELF
jgi:hypothetical protein